ncbi:MAG: ATP-binding cassette domain-containing protein [Pseudomonadota bacterium]
MDLTVSDLVVTAERGQVILSVPNLTVKAGALVGVRGPSGAGKSTLLFALAGLLGNAKGRVAWGDTDLIALSQGRRTTFRAANIGMIFQDFLLFEELSAQANADLAALFRPKRARGEISERARERLTHLAVPDQDRRVASFSGGERQRVAVARALAHDPPILLADEPTASLHRAAADALIDDLSTMVHEAGKSLIAVSHDTALLERMDRVVSIEDGQLAS